MTSLCTPCVAKTDKHLNTSKTETITFIWMNILTVIIKLPSYNYY